ncbi:C-type lectin domain family 4 member M-like [Megalobrama amblycephala]|uniref:C-type lectin domain family 4 member M-like n=1 Tax=Megalobrama amblycephala TaxID=75352 RepID=UPI0020141E38|nr:C-type lectin domain family 4 member M-like [Megalobrama amblycephala]XP_048012581.1 C-type lectin domain family 4 member M-like [Megalobrama amblycephala]XP_048012582.1 C-type lectin domain family 4 member M-like [Megalobrama amblycephala]
MEPGIFYLRFENKDTESTTGPKTETPSCSQDEGKAQKHRGSRCLVLMTVCLGLICVLLLVYIILQYFSITAVTNLFKSYKNKVEEFNQTINSLQDNYTDLMNEKNQLQNNINSLTQRKQELETRVNNLTAEKSRLLESFDSLTQKKQELETRVNNLTAEKSQLQNSFNSLSQKKLELETRVSNLTAEKSQLQSTINALNQKKLELETRVNDLTAEKSQLQSTINALNQKKLELETRVNDLTAEKSQLQSTINALNQKILQLESKVTSLSTELKQAYEKGYRWGSGWIFLSNGLNSWSESRQYCRNIGADLVIIKSEEKQRFINSIVPERAWIGLNDIQQEGTMKWVDNSPLNQGFWFAGEPNDAGGNEDCIEHIPYPQYPIQTWNDLPCSEMRKAICEK